MKTHLIICAIATLCMGFVPIKALSQPGPVCEMDFNDLVDSLWNNLNIKKSLSTEENYLKEASTAHKILERCACDMIADITSIAPYGIPASWLFEKANIKDLLDSPNVQIHGIRFYTGLDGYIQGTSKLALTLIAVPVNKTFLGYYNDHRLYKLYEHAQICPPYCKQNENTPHVLDQYGRTSPYAIPESFFISKSDLQSVLQRKDVTHLKLIRVIKIIDGISTLDISITGANRASNHLEIGPTLTDRTIVCPGECTTILDKICTTDSTDINGNTRFNGKIR